MKILLPTLALLLLGVGYFFRESQTTTQSEDKSVDHSAIQSSRHSSPRTPDQRSSGRNATQSDSERILRLIARIERSTLETLPDLAQSHKDERGLKLIILHWFNLDPNHLLETIVENQGNSAFPAQTALHFLEERWFEADFTGFVTALGNIPGNRRGIFFTDVYCSISEVDYQTGFRLMREAGITNTSPNSPVIDELAKENPQKLANDLRQKNTGYVLTAALGQVAKVWAKSEPEAALDYALGIQGKRGREVSQYALASWTKEAPQEAAIWLTSQNNLRLQDELRPALLRAWKKSDPEAARDHCLKNLSGFRQRKALRILAEKRNHYFYLDD